VHIQQADNYREQIITLLSAEKLPVDDLPETLENFIVALDNKQPAGAIGLEIYGDYALLRSMVVSPKYRGKGIASNLLTELESIAIKKSITNIYLLTETALGYFTRKGYLTITRDNVPATVQQSSEFSHVCPQSAIVMYKTLKPLS
jgi:amino-acid N-acetyltransferase